jgi:hypothetical protein
MLKMHYSLFFTSSIVNDACPFKSSLHDMAQLDFSFLFSPQVFVFSGHYMFFFKLYFFFYLKIIIFSIFKLLEYINIKNKF